MLLEELVAQPRRCAKLTVGGGQQRKSRTLVFQLPLSTVSQAASINATREAAPCARSPRIGGERA
ncbi:MAG: hypothetical protein IPK44_16340 [Candidatus Accumulibacter sp.]|uniref:hypothetical protein n=1 Tax=Accumulibacter sp. TaxID=2053492 RepID=UPI0025880E45|nr:hypothetical protein [Accumulibacter sp.]MBK8115943.1 hypothetical protein [Accumulibacter sp.]